MLECVPRVYLQRLSIIWSLYKSAEAQAIWDVPVYAEYNHVKANRVDARFVDHKSKKVMAVEMSCPWINNCEKEDEEKTLKYVPLRWELKQQFLSYRVEQYIVIIDVLAGWPRDLHWILPCERCRDLVEET